MLRVFYEISRRHMWTSPGRTALTVMGIALGVSVAVAIRSANVEVLRSFEDSVIAVAGRATIQVTGGELGLDERLIANVMRHPDVVSATPILQLTARVIEGPHSGRVLPIVAFDLLEAGDSKKVRFQYQDGAGASLDKILAPEAIFVGVRLAAEWPLHQGTTLRLAAGMHDYRVTVEGVIESDSNRPSMWESVSIMDIATAQILFGLIGRIDRIDVVTEPGRPIQTVIDQLQSDLPSSVIVTRTTGRTDQVERMTRAFQLNLTVLSMVSLLVGLFLVYNTVSFAVVRRRREIGILSAMGLSRRAVVILFIIEAAVLGLVGGLLGSAGGVLLARSLMFNLSQTISDLYVSVGGIVGPQSVVQFVLDQPISLWLGGAALGTGISIIGALVPSWDAGSTAPARALAPGDYESSRMVRSVFLGWIGLILMLVAALCALPDPVWDLPVFGYLASLCLLLGLSALIPLIIRLFGWLLAAAGQSHASSTRIRLPLLARLAGDHVSRTPGRNAVTISAMLVGISIMVGVDTMIGSFRDTVREWIEQTVISDLIVVPSSWLHEHETGQLANRIPVSWAEALSSIPGIAAIDTYRDLTIDLKGRRVALASRDLHTHAQRSRYLMTKGDSASVLEKAIATEGVVVSEVLARMIGLDTGDILQLTTPSGQRDFPVVGVFYDYATDGGKIVMDRSLYQRLWRDETATLFPVYVNKGADLSTVRRLLDERVRGMMADAGSRTPLIVISNVELKHDIMVIFDRTFTVTSILELIAIIIAVLGIMNTLVLSILQRRREFAMLRAMGITGARIRRLMVWESSYLGLMGGIVGVIGGILLSLLLIEVINKQSFGWTIQFVLQPRVLVQALALALAAAFVAAYLPAQWASRQSIAEGLRYE
jgi:putative ABC transport system permease protein